MTVQEVSRHLGLDWKTVKAINEVSICKGHRYLTVVLDYETGRVVWVGEGCKGRTLRRFFSGVSREQRQKLEAVMMDMWDPSPRRSFRPLPAKWEKNLIFLSPQVDEERGQAAGRDLNGQVVGSMGGKCLDQDDSRGEKKGREKRLARGDRLRRNVMISFIGRSHLISLLRVAQAEAGGRLRYPMSRTTLYS